MTLLEKIAGPRLQMLRRGVSDMFDMDSSKKGLAGLGDKMLGAAAIGVPAAAMYSSVARGNADNPELTDKQVVRRSTSVGASTGAVDGSMLALLHRSKKTLGEGLPGLGRRIAIYGGAGALINGAIAHHLAEKKVQSRPVNLIKRQARS